MKLDLVPGRFVRRYKRFFADVEIDRGVVTAHCPNTGSMKTLLNEGVEAHLKPSSDPKRKLKWTLTLLGLPRGGLAVVDTLLPNRIVEEGVRRGRIPELSGYSQVRREVRYGSRNSRVDLLLEGARGQLCYVEVKNVTMASSVVARRSDFPDSPTERGLKHLHELTDLAASGARVVQFYLMSRSDCRSAGIAEEIDPDYGEALRVAVDAGVEVIAYRARVTRRGVTVGKRCPFVIERTITD